MMSDGKIIRDCDTSYSEQNFINHAMINVINKSKILSKGKPEIIWTTKEPCLMCIMAAYYNGIREVVFGAYDEAAGFMSAKLLVDHSFLGISYRGGVLGKECAELLPESYQEHLKI
jgi:tRNA(Arg) A34 adenosine deaminase TadA